MDSSQNDAANGSAIAARPLYRPSTGTLLKILISNALLTLVTIGIYRFWAKTRIRRYIWSRLSFLDEPFEYSGTAKELFLGFLIILAILVPLIVARSVFELMLLEPVSGETLPFGLIVVEIVWVLLVLFLIQLALFRARRYRLTRTRWRGIVAGQSGSAFKYAFMALGLLLLTGLSLGLAYPFMNTALERYRIGNTWLGTERFSFDGEWRDLVRRWLLAWVLIPFTLGLSYIWYRAAELRYFTERTKLASLTFRSEITGGQIFRIYLLYGLSLILVSVVLGGIVWISLFGVIMTAMEGGQVAGQALYLEFLPVLLAIVFYLILSVLFTWLVMSRLLLAFCETLQVRGEMDFDALAQSTQAGPKTGEGLADALDLGGI